MALPFFSALYPLGWTPWGGREREKGRFPPKPSELKTSSPTLTFNPVIMTEVIFDSHLSGDNLGSKLSRSFMKLKLCFYISYGRGLNLPNLYSNSALNGFLQNNFLATMIQTHIIFIFNCSPRQLLSHCSVNDAGVSESTQHCG